MRSVVAFGELLLRLSPPGYGRFAQATALDVAYGGAEANVAVAIAQLGGQAEFITKLPANEIAERGIGELRRYGVETSRIVRGGERMGLYFLEKGASQRPGGVIYDRAGSALACAKPEEFDWAALLRGKAWLHWSGITPALSEPAARICAHALEAARAAGVKVSFDLNYRAKLWSEAEAARVLPPLLKGVHVCCVGAGEARTILGAEGETEESIAADLCRRYGFEAVAMTQRSGASASRTGWGAMLYAGGAAYASPRYEIEIVDRVGAGDSFTGGLIFALMRGDGPQGAINFAVAASALKHTIEGDFNLASLAEVEALAAGVQGGRMRR